MLYFYTVVFFFFFSSRRRHTRYIGDWSSDVCSSDLSGSKWLAWDAYREDDRYSLAWSLQFGSGSHRVPLGRTIHSAAVDQAGKWIAVSVGTGLKIGKAQDAVYVLSSADGHEVLRRYLPVYTRSPVTF